MFYNNCLWVCKQYIKEGPEFFLDRQIEYHLNKPPQDLTITDKEELAKWLKISSALLIGKEKANELMEQILALKE